MKVARYLAEAAAGCSSRAFEAAKPMLIMVAVLGVGGWLWENVGKGQLATFNEGRCAKKLEADFRSTIPSEDVTITGCSAQQSGGFICVVKSLGKDGIYRSESTATKTCGLTF